MANPVPSIENDASLTRSGDSRIKPIAGKHPLVTQVDNHKHQEGFPALHLMPGHNVSKLNRSNLGLTCECHVKGALAIPEFDLEDRNSVVLEKIVYIRIIHS